MQYYTEKIRRQSRLKSIINSRLNVKNAIRLIQEHLQELKLNRYRTLKILQDFKLIVNRPLNKAQLLITRKIWFAKNVI